MDRREFGRTALGMAAATIIAPSALAAKVAPRSISDCIVIDYKKPVKRWRKLLQPDAEGRTSVFENSTKTVSYRHFEFLGSDGLVVGRCVPKAHWAKGYNAFETEFASFYKCPKGKSYAHSDFVRYVEDIRLYLNGRYVPISDL